MKHFKHYFSAVIVFIFIIIAFGSTDNTCTSCMDVQYAENVEDVKEAYDDSFEEIQGILESLCEDFISGDKTLQAIKTDYGFLLASIVSILDSYPYNNTNLQPEEQEEVVKYGLNKLKTYPDLYHWYKNPGAAPCVSDDSKPIPNWQK